ncbi:hypothetical protein HN873_056075 [Arachis hypogaea]
MTNPIPPIASFPVLLCRNSFSNLSVYPYPPPYFCHHPLLSPLCTIEKMSKETVTDHAVSPVDLAEHPISTLIDIVRTDEKSADCDLVEAELVRREEIWEARLRKISDELFEAGSERVNLMVKLKKKEDQLEEEEKARRREEKLLHREQQHCEATVRRMYDKANEMMAESSKWRDLVQRIVNVLEAKEKSLAPQAGVQPMQIEHSDREYPPLLCWCLDEKMAEEHAKGDVVRVIKAAGEPSRPMRLPLRSGLLPKGSNHIYITVADGSDRTYKIACSPKGLKEITLGRGWQRFYHDYKLQPFNILLFKHKGRDDFSVRIFKAPGVERTYAASGDDSGDLTPPRSVAAAEVEQTFQSEHPYFIMHITERLLRVHFLPNVPHFGDDVSDDVMVTLRAGEIFVRADYARYRGNRSHNCGTIGGGWADFLRKCNVTVEKLAVFEISRTNPDVELLVQFVDFE